MTLTVMASKRIEKDRDIGEGEIEATPVMAEELLFAIAEVLDG